MEVDSEKGCAIVYGVVGHTEFRYDGVCTESVLGDFLETIVGNCVLLHIPIVVPMPADDGFCSMHN